MLHELRFYEIAPGRLQDYVQHAGAVAIPFRGDRFGRLLGFWSCEVGALNCVFNLWEHESVESREALRAQLQKEDVWRHEYLPYSQPLMRRQFSRLLRPVGAVTPPATPGNLFVIRIFRTCAGKTQAFASHLRDRLPRSVAAGTVACWTGNTGDVNEVIYLSAHPQDDAITHVLQSAEWHRVLQEQGDVVDNVRSSLMMPVPYSPWR
jgi:hypothetical protein